MNTCLIVTECYPNFQKLLPGTPTNVRLRNTFGYNATLPDGQKTQAIDFKGFFKVGTAIALYSIYAAVLLIKITKTPTHGEPTIKITGTHPQESTEEQDGQGS
ncbi:MAG: hypothetical protein VW274_06790 [Thalassolituus sp.]